MLWQRDVFHAAGGFETLRMEVIQGLDDSLARANRDTEVFDDPDAFDPDRKERDFLAFGHGAHFCLGSHLARREMEVSLRVLSERLPDMVFADGAEPGIQGTVLRGPQTLPVEFRSS